MTKGVWKTGKQFKEEDSPSISQKEWYFSEIFYAYIMEF